MNRRRDELPLWVTAAAITATIVLMYALSVYGMRHGAR